MLTAGRRSEPLAPCTSQPQEDSRNSRAFKLLEVWVVPVVNLIQPVSSIDACSVLFGAYLAAGGASACSSPALRRGAHPALEPLQGRQWSRQRCLIFPQLALMCSWLEVSEHVTLKMNKGSFVLLGMLPGRLASAPCLDRMMAQAASFHLPL